MHKAKNFFIENWNDEKHLIHCQAVINSCLGMVQNTDFNVDVFIIAGWIHDMGKTISVENHHKFAEPLLDKFFEMNPIYKYLKPEIMDCIINHRTSGKPETIYGQVFKVADKIALRNLRWLRFYNK